MSILPWRSSGDKSDRVSTWIGEDLAIYGEDGRMLCPRCEYNNPDFASLGGMRELECMRCGYSGRIKDGVYLFKDTGDSDGE